MPYTIAHTRPDYARAVRKLAAKCALFVEHYWSKLERQGGIPEVPMDRRSKGSSNPPFSEAVMELIEANKVASGYFRFHLEFLETSYNKTTNGVYCSHVLKSVRDTPWALANWRAGETEYSRTMMAAFHEVCEQVAKGVLFVHPDLQPDNFTVYINRKDVAVRGKGEEAANVPSHTVDGANTRIAKSVADLQAKGYSEAGAVAAKAEQMMWSEEKVWEAVRYAKGDRSGLQRGEKGGLVWYDTA